MNRLAFAALTVVLCAGCATPGETPSSDVRVDRVYRTGSNLPSTEISRTSTQTIDPATIRIPTPQPPRGTGN